MHSKTLRVEYVSSLCSLQLYSLQKIYSKIVAVFLLCYNSNDCLATHMVAWKGCSIAIDQNLYVQDAKGERHTPSTVKLKASLRVSSPFTYLVCNLTRLLSTSHFHWCLLCFLKDFLGKAVHIQNAPCMASFFSSLASTARDQLDKKLNFSPNMLFYNATGCCSFNYSVLS